MSQYSTVYTWVSCSPRLYTYLRDRGTRTLCSQQIATRTRRSEFMVWALERKEDWREISGDLFSQKASSHWKRATTSRKRHCLCEQSNVLDVTLDKRMMCKYLKGRSVNRTVIRAGDLSTNINYILQSTDWVMPYASPTCWYATDAHLMKM